MNKTNSFKACLIRSVLFKPNNSIHILFGLLNEIFEYFYRFARLTDFNEWANINETFIELNYVIRSIHVNEKLSFLESDVFIHRCIVTECSFTSSKVATKD